MLRTSTFSLLLLAAAGCSTTLAKQPATEASVGQAAPDFALTDLGGTEHVLSAHTGKTVVLEWFNPGCPFVKQAHGEGGVLADMATRATKSDDVVWLAINSGAPGKQGHGVQANTDATKDWSMAHPVLIDEDGQVGRRYGAATTPHMYVVDKEGTLVYEGAIDNKPLGKGEGEHVNYVEKALASLAAGEPVAIDKTKPYGCSVKY